MSRRTKLADALSAAKLVRVDGLSISHFSVDTNGVNVMNAAPRDYWGCWTQTEVMIIVYCPNGEIWFGALAISQEEQERLNKAVKKFRFVKNLPCHLFLQQLDQITAEEMAERGRNHRWTPPTTVTSELVTALAKKLG